MDINPSNISIFMPINWDNVQLECHVVEDHGHYVLADIRRYTIGTNGAKEYFGGPNLWYMQVIHDHINDQPLPETKIVSGKVLPFKLSH